MHHLITSSPKWVQEATQGRMTSRPLRVLLMLSVQAFRLYLFEYLYLEEHFSTAGMCLTHIHRLLAGTALQHACRVFKGAQISGGYCLLESVLPQDCTHVA